jgi:formylglycine-generating enzyme required for sulfatase activity
VDPLDATELTDDSKANETITSGAPVLRAIETSTPPEREDQFEVSGSELGDKTSLTGAQPKQTGKEDLPAGNISEPRLDELRRATQQARRRAEERAFRELSESAEARKIRPTSMPPTLGQLAPEPSKLDPKSLLKKPLVLGAGAAAVIVTIIVVLLVVNLSSSVEPQPVGEKVPAPTRPQRDMVLINGGGFTIGSDTAGPQQKGAHFENVKSFYMDKTEVTNEEYAAFIKATGYRVPTNEVAGVGWWKPWNGSDPPQGRERWPVSNVSAKDAEAYAQWVSSRDGVKYQLPSEAQWEFAARNGADETLFPWGNNWDNTRANLNGKTSPTAVGSSPTGQTSTGLLDMVGNVWEWTSSRASYYDSRPVDAEFATARVRRGGSFAEKIKEHFVNATDRGWYGNEDYKFPTIGFRLVRDAP